MKKIFWTSIFWIAVVVLFWAYVKLFNVDLAGQVAHWIYQERVVIQTGVNEQAEDMVIINDQLNKINDRLVDILGALNVDTSGQLPQDILPAASGTLTNILTK